VTQPRIARASRRFRLAAAWLFALACSSAVALGAPLARAESKWWDEARIQVKVHDHVFHRVTANALGCSVRVRLHFDAPSSAYGEPAPDRNHYRFSVQMRFSDDRSFVSEPVANDQSGARVISFKHDTTGEGCWAEQAHTVRKVDVHACRGVGCLPQPFE
jgi:hypothetical protein